MKLLELCGEARTHRTSEPKVSVCNLKNAKNLQSKSVTYFFSLCIGRFFFGSHQGSLMESESLDLGMSFDVWKTEIRKSLGRAEMF